MPRQRVDLVDGKITICQMKMDSVKRSGGGHYVLGRRPGRWGYQGIPAGRQEITHMTDKSYSFITY